MNANVTAAVRVLEVAFTGYPVIDVSRARAFYEGTLGLKPSATWEDGGKFWIEYDIGPATLAISNMASEWKPSPQGPSVALEVEDFDGAIAALRAAGVTFTLEPTSSSVCRMAVVLDPDGNAVTIHKRNAQ